LFEAAAKQIKTSGADLVIANDLRDLRAGEHKLYFVKNEKGKGPTLYRTIELEDSHGTRIAFGVIKACYEQWKYEK
jgi:hypothetical protein